MTINYRLQSLISIISSTVIMVVWCGLVHSATEPIVFKDPDGNHFIIETYSDEVPNARQMAETESGILFVGSRRAGNVYGILPDSADVFEVARQLQHPSGIALLDGDLYVAAYDRLLRFENIEETFKFSPQADVVTDKLPVEGVGNHGWKYLSVGPDKYLYLNIGAPCNVCLREDERFASILRVNPKNGEMEVYARGVRNSVGSAWHPETKLLWFSDNGRDWMGDDIPPDEINVVETPGTHFGFPFVHGDDIIDPQFGDQRDEAVDYVQPVVNIQAHAAALGIDFYTKKQFPPSYKNALFIAEHGSWNRSSKVGYQVSVVQEIEGELRYRSFISIWTDGILVRGRPADVLVNNKGFLYIADDFKGKIYQVSYLEQPPEDL